MCGFSPQPLRRTACLMPGRDLSDAPWRELSAAKAPEAPSFWWGGGWGGVGGRFVGALLPAHLAYGSPEGRVGMAAISVVPLLDPAVREACRGSSAGGAPSPTICCAYGRVR